GRAAEAEDRLRDALARKREPALLVELGAVLIQRSRALESTSDLGESLRVGVLGEALDVYGEAGKAPETAVDAAIGAATCHSLLGRADDAVADMQQALTALRERK